MTAPIPILITCVGGAMMPSALRWLKEHGRFPVSIHGCDAAESPLAASFVDVFHTIPFGDAPDYGETMLRLVKAHGIKVVVPGSDAEAFALANIAGDLAAAGAAITTSPAPVLATLRDKAVTYAALEQAGVAVPVHRVIDRPGDLADALSDCGYPARTTVIKPADGRGGRGVAVLIGEDGAPEWMGAGQREARLDAAAFADCDPAALITGRTMVMPALRAPVYDVDILADNGSVQATVVRRRHNLAGIPWTGNTICRDERFESYARDAAAALGLSGAHDMDLMSDDDGRPALLEVNPRMSGSLAASLAAGIPFLDAAIGMRIGIELPVGLPDHDVEVVPYTEAVAR
ncbi:MAG: ATP-grasp domain-containing protein [Rhodospirillales bacterium]